MNDRILIAYATTHGSTREIAERVADRLRQAGLSVDITPAAKVRSLDGYSAIVLGASIYMFRMHRDARQFLARHQNTLSGGLPLAIFAGGPYGANAEADQVDIRTKLDQELAGYAWLKPAAVKIVGGRFDPSGLRFPWSLIPALRNAPPSDARNWDDISAWAGSLPELLSTASGQTA